MYYLYSRLSQICALVGFVGTLVISHSVRGGGQGVFSNPVDVAVGPVDASVFESHLAVGPDSAVAVYICADPQEFDDFWSVCYSVYDRKTGVWSESAIPVNSRFTPPAQAGDPVVAYNRFSDTILLVALETTGGGQTRDIACSRFDRSAFETWRNVTNELNLKDKPWVVGGTADEFYITYFDHPAVEPGKYARTTDGGATWVVEGIRVDGEPVIPVAPQMKVAAFADSAVYVVHQTSAPPGEDGITYAFLEGTDRADGGVDFATLLAPDDEQLLVTIKMHVDFLDEWLPGTFSSFNDVELAVDPNDPDRLYFTYADAVAPQNSGSPIGMFTVLLARQDDRWTASSPVQVDGGIGFNRFMPTMTVDDRSRLHVTFYDDRDFAQSDSEPVPQFGLFYTVAEADGTGFAITNQALDDDPVLNFPLLGSAYEPREYMGLDNYAGEIWTAYMATFEPPGSCSSDSDCDDLNPCSVEECLGGACNYPPPASSPNTNECIRSKSLIRSRVIDYSQRRFVSPFGDDANDGKTWNSAFRTLSQALQVAGDPDDEIMEIRVAEGTYAAGDPGDRTATFVLIHGVNVVGGFEAGADDPARDPEAFPTILSGLAAHCDIDSDCPGAINICVNGLCSQGQQIENAPYHIITADGVGATTTLDGFIIEYGNANGTGDDANGAGIWMRDSKLLVRNCTIRNNSAGEDGGGTFASGGAPTFFGCTFDQNECTNGGALFVHNACRAAVLKSTFSQNTGSAEGGGIAVWDTGSTMRVQGSSFHQNSTTGSGGAICAFGEVALDVLNSSFVGNSAGTSGGGVLGSGASSVVVSNSYFHGNWCILGAGGGAIFSSGDLTVTNSTLSENSASKSLGGGIYAVNNTPTIANSIVWGNTDSTGSGQDAQITTYLASASVSFSCIQDDTPGASPFPFPAGAGNIDMDPQFADQMGGDLRLSRSSPCIDAGNNDADIDASVTGVQRLSDRDADNEPRFEDDRVIADTGAGVGPIVDMGAFESPLRPIYVDGGATCGAGCDGQLWETAFTDLQDALAGAQAGEQIWVAAGTYTPATCAPGSCTIEDRQQSFALKNGVTLLGGFAGTEESAEERNFGINDSILSGDIDGNDVANDPFAFNANNSFHVVTASNVDETAVVDGFVIQRGNANGSGTDAQGGGAHLDFSDPVFRHCRFLGNSANDQGGGVYSITSGAGGTYINCLYSGNESLSSDGGAAFLQVRTARFVNCTIASNSAPVGDGGGARLGLFGEVLDLTNCVLWGNSDAAGVTQASQLSFAPGFAVQPRLNYSVIENPGITELWPGTQNTDEDPEFMDADGPDNVFGTLDDDLRPGMFESSVINRGLNSVILPIASLDLNGTPRLSSTEVDSGAYEYELILAGSPFIDFDPDFVPANRYISFQPGQMEAAIAITLTESNLFPDLIGETWWVGSPDSLHPDLFSVGCDIVARDWSKHPTVIHVGDEYVFPDSTYQVTSVFDGGVAATFPIELISVAPWGDIVGGPDGQGGWLPPNGVVNIDDVNAVIDAYQGGASAPPIPWADVEPAVVNFTVNLADAFTVTQAFQGAPYSFAEPLPCP